LFIPGTFAVYLFYQSRLFYLQFSCQFRPNTFFFGNATQSGVTSEKWTDYTKQNKTAAVFY